MRFSLISGTVLLALAACGTTDTQRAATGAVGGAVAGEILFDEPILGAAVGGVAGALSDDIGR